MPAILELTVEVETKEPSCAYPISAKAPWNPAEEAMPPAKVEVAVDVEVIEPVVRVPVVMLEKVAEMVRKMLANKLVVVALEAKRFTKVEVAVEVAVMTPVVS